MRTTRIRGGDHEDSRLFDAFVYLSGDEGGHHFAGPVAKTEIEHLGPGDLELETGYLFALRSARDGARGQFRLLAAYAFPF